MPFCRSACGRARTNVRDGPELWARERVWGVTHTRSRAYNSGQSRTFVRARPHALRQKGIPDKAEVNEIQLAHQDAREPVADSVDHLGTDTHVLLGVPAEIEGVGEPVHDVEDQVDVECVNNALIRHSSGPHRVNVGTLDLVGSPSDLLQ